MMLHQITEERVVEPDGEIKEFSYELNEVPLSPIIQNVGSLNIRSPKSSPKKFPNNENSLLDSPSKKGKDDATIILEMPPRAPKKVNGSRLEKCRSLPQPVNREALVEKCIKPKMTKKQIKSSQNLCSFDFNYPTFRVGRRNSSDERQKTEAPIAKIRRTNSVTDAVELYAESDPRKQTCILPTLDAKPSESTYKKISSSTLSTLLLDENYLGFDEVWVVDCRFDYEFQGGHIINAININDKNLLERVFLEKPAVEKKVCVVFHCEFSKHRGPKMYEHLRKKDRELMGSIHYPNLYYPEIYLLDGGYEKFFEEFSELCHPCSYIKMEHADFQAAKDENMARDQRQWDEKKKK